MKKFFNFVKNKKVKCIITLSILFTIYIFITSYSYVLAISSNLSSNIFRLHVIANSDSDEDQKLKYIVRDNLISYMNTLCINCNSKKEVIDIANKHLEQLQEIAQNTVYENGFSYTTTVEIGNFEFPTKTYGDISFPAGFYDALKVKIGNASGQNWWCVMFPPLCFVDITSGIVPDDSKEQLQDNLSSEEYSIISDSNNYSYNLKFKIIELFEKNHIITAKGN